MRFFLSLFLIARTFLFAADFDVVVVGSSPFSLFEALYQYHSGKSVLILEEADTCGGAWKSIEICGIPNADLGCHQIGNGIEVKKFLEEYAGCHIVSLDKPLVPFDPVQGGPNGYYFSKGCFELVDNLLRLVRGTDIVLMTHHKVERVAIDSSQKIATLYTKDESFTTDKLIVTPMSCFHIVSATPVQDYAKTKYYHLYLLVQDPTPPRFSYQGGFGSGISRLMNLTHFVGLTDTGRHLVVIQTSGEHHLADAEAHLKALKERNLVDSSAYILKAEPYIYEAGTFHPQNVFQMGGQGIIEVLQTGHLQNLAMFISKWKSVLKPYQEALTSH